MMFVAFFKRALIAALLIATPAAYAELVIEDAWVRAVPPNSRTTAGYSTVRNTGAEEQVIVAVSASIAGAAEIHDWIETDGRKKMVRQHQVTVPADGEVVFQTGGLHMMLFRLDPVPAPGDKVQLCMATDAGAQVCADAMVRHP